MISQKGVFMYKFQKGVYADVRIEDVFETKVTYKNNDLEQQKVKKYKGAFIRVFDGQRWYYGATTELDQIQNELDALSKMATPMDDIESHPIVKNFEVHNKKSIMFENNSVENISVDEKKELLKSYFPIFDIEEIVQRNYMYVDKRVVKSFYSSKGSDLVFDNQTVGIRAGCEFVIGEEKGRESFTKAFTEFEPLKSLKPFFEEQLATQLDYVTNAVNVESGEYTVVLSPMATGVFTHESFGHKSESDFMIGDENMKKEWELGKKVGSDQLSIIDEGDIPGTSGYTPYDDEGVKKTKTYLIKDGVLTGRLHSEMTAGYLGEEATGNARAMNFNYEPIVRMTNTYIGAGDLTFDELIAPIENGFYLKKSTHGSGMSTFTIAIGRAWRIKDGKIAEPVKVNVVSGTIFETLFNIDALTKDVEILSFVGGGCGKMEQFPLPVGFGGPYVRVKEITVS